MYKICIVNKQIHTANWFKSLHVALCMSGSKAKQGNKLKRIQEKLCI